VVEVYNERLYRWEGPEHINELAASVPWTLHLQIVFHHARKTRPVTASLGGCPCVCPPPAAHLGVGRFRPGLPTPDRPTPQRPAPPPSWRSRCTPQWRCRLRIEHTYRFDQKQGLDVEDMRVQPVERMRRAFVLVFLAVLFMYHIART
jgi:hypothetical protein